MLIKLDENLPEDLAPLLTTQGHDVDTVCQEFLSGRHDSEIWKAAQEAGRLLVTQDLDFSDMRRYRPGTHCGLILFRLHNPSRVRLITRIQEIFVSEDVEQWGNCIVVITDNKIRIRRPE